MRVAAYVGSFVCFSIAGLMACDLGGRLKLPAIGSPAILERLDQIDAKLSGPQIQYQQQTVTPTTRIYHDTRPTTKTGPELEAAADRLIAQHR